ncbi:DNA polymerase III subunit delta' [Pyruvatibacter sp. HU-CL02332]|uniref:DNA polymerase III subunit delta' n=1 Tax=Pyruvatibacter sp. HU-CL02332 TaxID=3127650 RepID=UPI0031069B03
MARSPEPFDVPQPDQLEGFPHPRDTEMLYGHQPAEDALREAFMAGRLHHAWLITGPAGIGKATLAYRFARFLLKYGDPRIVESAGIETLHIPPEDEIFKRVSSRGHANVLTLRKPWNDKTKKYMTVLSVDEVRRTHDFFGMKAGEGGWRICIVDSADDMNTSSANALLKVLEEPPAQTIFLVLANHPGRLLPTIRSRCRTLPLKPLSHDQLLSAVHGHLGHMADGDMEAVAKLAQGSVGRALLLAGGGGIELYREMHGVIASLPKPDVPAVHALAEKLARRGNDQAYEMFRELLSDWLVRLVRQGAGGPAMIDEVIAGEADIMNRLAAGASLDRWVEVWENTARTAERAEALNLDRKQVVLGTFAALETAARG